MSLSGARRKPKMKKDNDYRTYKISKAGKKFMKLRFSSYRIVSSKLQEKVNNRKNVINYSTLEDHEDGLEEWTHCRYNHEESNGDTWWTFIETRSNMVELLDDDNILLIVCMKQFRDIVLAHENVLFSRVGLDLFVDYNNKIRKGLLRLNSLGALSYDIPYTHIALIQRNHIWNENGLSLLPSYFVVKLKNDEDEYFVNIDQFRIRCSYDAQQFRKFHLLMARNINVWHLRSNQIEHFPICMPSSQYREIKRIITIEDCVISETFHYITLRPGYVSPKLNPETIQGHILMKLIIYK